MPRVVGDFQALHPGISVGLMTLPPGTILLAIQAHGWSFGDARLALQPDVFATVSTEQLRDTGEITSYSHGRTCQAQVVRHMEDDRAVRRVIGGRTWLPG
jgi:hypothetical protein